MMVRACVLALGLLACGSKAREPRTHQVEIRGMQYVPAELAVEVGDTVVWTNVDVLPHTVTSTAREFDSLQLASKQQWRYQVLTPGEYTYVCTYHPTMRGKLVAR